MRTYLSKESLILLATPLFLIGGYYYPLSQDIEIYFVTVWIYLFFAPLALLLFLGEDLKQYGLTWKKWPFSVSRTLLGLLLVALLMFGASKIPEYRDYYLASAPKDLLFHSTVVLGSYYFAEEFLFRGFLLFGLKKRFGEFSIIIQTIPFALFHMGKPGVEAIFSVFAGLVLGHIAYKSDSFLPVFFIHWFIGILSIVFIFF